MPDQYTENNKALKEAQEQHQARQNAMMEAEESDNSPKEETQEPGAAQQNPTMKSPFPPNFHNQVIIQQIINKWFYDTDFQERCINEFSRLHQSAYNQYSANNINQTILMLTEDGFYPHMQFILSKKASLFSEGYSFRLVSRNNPKGFLIRGEAPDNGLRVSVLPGDTFSFFNDYLPKASPKKEESKTTKFLNAINHVLNPFNAARFAGNHSPDSRSLQSSFKDKFNDTRRVIRGENSSTTKSGSYHPGRFGLFDYATLFIFKLLDVLQASLGWIMSRSTKNKSTPVKVGIRLTQALAFLPWAGVSLVNLIVNKFIANKILRPAVSLVLAIALSPFILVAHIITHRIANAKAKKLAHEMMPNPTDSSTAKLTLALANTSLVKSASLLVDRETNELLLGEKVSNQWQLVGKLPLPADSPIRAKLAEINPWVRKQLLPVEECKPRL